MPLVVQREVPYIAESEVDDGQVHTAACFGRVADSGDGIVELAEDKLDCLGSLVAVARSAEEVGLVC